MFRHPDVDIFLNYDLTSFTTFRLKSTGDIAIVRSLEGLKELLYFLNSQKRNYRLIGWGANQILPESLEPMLIKLQFSYDEKDFSQAKDSFYLPASVGLSTLTSVAIKLGLGGWELMTGIPASLGGAIFMNAGTKLGEMSYLVRELEVMDGQGNIKNISVSEKNFSYRKNLILSPGEIITGARLIHHGIDQNVASKIKEYMDYRQRTQPLKSKNCGCVFKNYSDEILAGKTIDELGLKGLSVGPLSVSKIHSNFFENTGGATSIDFFTLVELIQSKVKSKTGIEFELEVKID